MTASRTVHVLHVEDNEVDVIAMQRAFQRHRIANPITVAKHGEEALAILRGEDGHSPLPRPYVILLDINLPRMNGLELLDVLRHDPELRSSVVFVLTTSHHDEDILKAHELNVAGYVTKEKAGEMFADLVVQLEGYWRIAELPD